MYANLDNFDVKILNQFKVMLDTYASPEATDALSSVFPEGKFDFESSYYFKSRSRVFREWYRDSDLHWV